MLTLIKFSYTLGKERGIDKFKNRFLVSDNPFESSSLTSIAVAVAFCDLKPLL